MKSAILLALTPLLVIWLTGCGTDSANIYSPPATPLQASQSGPGLASAPPPPEACVVFVMDDSASMEAYVRQINENVPKMVDVLIKASAVRPRIAVTTVHDNFVTVKSETEHFYPLSPLCSDSQYSGHAACTTPVVRQTRFRPVAEGEGAFLKLRGPGGIELQGPRFVTRRTTYQGHQGSAEDAPSKVLAETLKLQIRGIDANGPVVERVFGPIMQALGNRWTAAGQPNHGFLTRDCKLSIVTVSDAGEGSLDVTATQLHQRLLQIDPHYKFFMFSPNLENENSAPRNSLEFPTTDVSRPYTNFTLAKFSELLRLGEGRVARFDLYSNSYAQQLTRIGDEIRRSASDVVIRTNGLVDWTKVIENQNEDLVQVYYGRDCNSNRENRGNPQLCQKIENDNDSGWTLVTLDRGVNAIRINANTRLNAIEDGQFYVDYTGVLPANLAHGRVQRLGQQRRN